ncbi:tetratricopeptide repeat protein [Streptomyces zagrosensis]|uniref:Tetratricopeptide (TPR) repeat protein n=1 Tax=Streptomyces zagrosensis TaxID=1042984 RepID=A0A7W9UY93_9ACTN|nr:tetratricopeptide repeat protein [Streptomyces zagrosensis]MBB5935116.1 tetratricopeptide (TPR) repeat protein [Streptomyces zagrosensis]
MASAAQSSSPRPNAAFRHLRGQLSPGEFAALVRRSAREIGEQVSCDARYIGRVEAGAIRCPNYAYERVFRHMFPDRTLLDLGFAPRESVRGHGSREAGVSGPTKDTNGAAVTGQHAPGGGARATRVPRRPLPAEMPQVPRPHGRIGTTQVAALEKAVRHIRLLDDRHGADGIYRGAAQPLSDAYELLDAGTEQQSISDRLHAGAGELAISVGWLAHDSGRVPQARSHYAEALATARLAGDLALEAHAFCNIAFLARDAQRPREAVRAAQAAQHAGRRLGSPRLLSLLALREAGGRAGLGDRSGCERALLRAQRLFDAGPSEADPEWMTFYGQAECAGLEAQCWSALRHWERAVEHARQAVALQSPHFVRNRALFTTELAMDLVGCRLPDEAAAAGERVLALLGDVQSTRIQAMLDELAQGLRPWRREAVVARFLACHREVQKMAGQKM